MAYLAAVVDVVEIEEGGDHAVAPPLQLLHLGVILRRKVVVVRRVLLARKKAGGWGGAKPW